MENGENEEQVLDIQAPLKFLHLLNNYNHYELRNIFANMDLTEEEKQELNMQGHKDVLQMFNDLQATHARNGKKKEDQKTTDDPDSEHKTADDTNSQQQPLKVTVFDKEKIKLLDKIAQRMYVERKIGKRNSLLQAKVYAKKNVRLGAGHALLSPGAAIANKVDTKGAGEVKHDGKRSR